MFKRNYRLVLGLWFILVAVIGVTIIGAEGLSPNEIIVKLDQNNTFQTAYLEARMEITIGSRKVTKTIRIWSDSDNRKTLAEFIDKRDQSRILKIKDDLWLFSPSAESEVKLCGDMLKQGMAGSDFSYQDALESEHLLDLYDVKLIGEETSGARSCYILELIAKKEVEVSYYRRKMWVDKERFIQLREELYAPSGKLLKLATTEKVDQFDQRYYPTITVMEDKLRKNSNTRFIIDQIRFNVAIPPGTFTRQRLTGR
jgi:outer membrane lipoprotein-sorting protein